MLQGNYQKAGNDMRKGQKVKTAWVNSPQADAVAEYYVAGHSVKETAEKYNVTVCQVNNLAKRRKLTNGRTHGTVPAWANIRRSDEAEKRMACRLEPLGFEYVGGYQDKHVKIRCRRCGFEFERSADFAKRGNVICPECERKRILTRQTEQRTIHKIDIEQKKRRAEVEKANALFHLLNDKTHVCSVCGNRFSVSDYMQSAGITLIPTSPKYCSRDCRRKATNKARKKAPSGRTGNYYDRARKYGCKYIPGITLKKLIERDGMKCQICGGICDWNDHSWSGYTGPTYPSIDHIIPMAKGGGHTWENVQVAHIICNSEKGDKVAT